MVGRDGVTRWVLDQMWLRRVAADGRRIIDGVVTDITSRKEAELGMRRLAHSDSLTGLANRLQLAERIDAAVAGLARPTRRASRCCCSTSTGSRRSTTASVTRSATSC